MIKALKQIEKIQELDMQMLRLMRLKKERKSELNHIDSLRRDLNEQLVEKQNEITELDKNILMQENKIRDIKARLKELEKKQSAVKKVDEFNALTQEMTTSERERVATEHLTSDLIDRRNTEEEILVKIKDSLATSETSTSNLEKEIQETIEKINQEGRQIKEKRDAQAKDADPEFMKIYEKLLNNKRDRVVVPIENRTCSGCHIALTAQHENLVRKGERIIFCEHCARILFWPEVETKEGETTPRRRRRRSSTSITL